MHTRTPRQCPSDMDQVHQLLPTRMAQVRRATAELAISSVAIGMPRMLHLHSLYRHLRWAKLSRSIVQPPVVLAAATSTLQIPHGDRFWMSCCKWVSQSRNWNRMAISSETTSDSNKHRLWQTGSLLPCLLRVGERLHHHHLRRQLD